MEITRGSVRIFLCVAAAPLGYVINLFAKKLRCYSWFSVAGYRLTNRVKIVPFRIWHWNCWNFPIRNRFVELASADWHDCKRSVEIRFLPKGLRWLQRSSGYRPVLMCISPPARWVPRLTCYLAFTKGLEGAQLWCSNLWFSASDVLLSGQYRLHWHVLLR